jgi:hypothetical protein
MGLAMSDADLISLTDAIAGLRDQIREAAKKALALPPQQRFRIVEAELELTVVAEGKTDAGAEVGWWIFKARANVSAKDAITHKVRLKLNVGDVEVASDTQTT